MTQLRTRCLILACGNTLRGDDGIGPFLAQRAEERFGGDARVRIVASQQWTLELVDQVARAETVLFVDCSVAVAAGSVCVVDVQPAAQIEKLDTHQQGAAELLGLARDLYASLPRAALLLTVGAGSLELGEEFSGAVTAALPVACARLEEAVVRLLAGS